MRSLVVTLMLLTAPTKSPPRITTGGRFIQHLADRHWAAAEAMLNPVAATAMSEAQLQMVWEQVLMQLGDLESIDHESSTHMGKYRVDDVACTLTHGPVTFRVSVDEERQVLAFKIGPPSSEDMPWQPPVYADSRRFTETQVEVGPQHLAGMLVIPEKVDHFPMVVMLAGSGPNDMDESLPPIKVFRDLADGLASKGIGSLRFEKRTHRGLPVVTVKEEYLDDADAAIAQAAAVPGVTKVVLLGHSMGATLAPRVALGNSKVAALVLLAGSTWSFAKASVAQLEYQKQLGYGGKEIDKMIADAKAEAKRIEDPQLQATKRLSYGVTGAYYLDLRSYDPVATTAKLGLPTFLAWGDRDLKVIPDDWAGWRKGLGERPNLTYRSYPGLQHLFTPVGTADVKHVAVDVITDLATWLTREPNPSPPQQR